MWRSASTASRIARPLRSPPSSSTAGSISAGVYSTEKRTAPRWDRRLSSLVFSGTGYRLVCPGGSFRFVLLGLPAGAIGRSLQAIAPTPVCLVQRLSSSSPMTTHCSRTAFLGPCWRRQGTNASVSAPSASGGTARSISLASAMVIATTSTSQASGLRKSGG